MRVRCVQPIKWSLISDHSQILTWLQLRFTACGGLAILRTSTLFKGVAIDAPIAEAAFVGRYQFALIAKLFCRNPLAHIIVSRFAMVSMVSLPFLALRPLPEILDVRAAVLPRPTRGYEFQISFDHRHPLKGYTFIFVVAASPHNRFPWFLLIMKFQSFLSQKCPEMHVMI